MVKTLEFLNLGHIFYHNIGYNLAQTLAKGIKWNNIMALPLLPYVKVIR